MVLRCTEPVAARVRYVFDTLLMPCGIAVVYVNEPPSDGPWLLYAATPQGEPALDRAAAIAHCPSMWLVFEDDQDAQAAHSVDGLRLPLPALGSGFAQPDDIPFDLAANAFYFLSSWTERTRSGAPPGRALYSNSVFARLELAQDIVDQYQARLLATIARLHARLHIDRAIRPRWPGGDGWGIVLSHDVDFIPRSLREQAVQGAKSVARSLIRHRDVADAARVVAGLARAIAQRRDPYGCIPQIIAQEQALGVRSSFQVAVGHRHPADVNYFVEDDATRDYLKAIPDAGFDLCLHGSYRSAENPAWYAEEVELLAQRLARPAGSRQHYLSFAFDALFRAQEAAGIEYDMSMGYPDRPGPRAGFSFPYFPFCLAENRPYRVLEISLFLMDVTLRGYMDLRAPEALAASEVVLDGLKAKGGCASVVWHPIVFGAARDPGYDRVFWKVVEHVHAGGGFCTDGAAINQLWRARAALCTSFQ
jgi:hypothetical protein